MTTRRHFILGLATLPFQAAFAKSKEPFPVSASDPQLVEYRFRRREVPYQTKLPKGTLFADIRKRYLYLILGDGKAIRYGVGIGRAALAWEGEAVIKRKAKWPSWHPTPEMLNIYKSDGPWRDGMAGGPKNPLGARALYLYENGVDTLFRIHGTHEPQTVGTASSRGCLRMVNVDIIDLYDRVPVGTRVIVSRSGKAPS